MKQENSNPTLQELSLGISDFDIIRSQQLTYVDKTDLIVQLIKSASYMFLSRPQGFGKSLLISTLSELFEKGSIAFKDLKGENLWQENKTYPIIRLEFSEFAHVQTKESFKEKFYQQLDYQIQHTGLETYIFPTSNPIDLWAEFLINLPTSSIVLLIDEYDAPLRNALHDETRFNDFQKILREFFSTTKSYSGKIRFIFISGIIKF